MWLKTVLTKETVLANFRERSRKLEGKYSLESTDPRESEIRAPPQPLPYLMPLSLIHI